MTEEEWSVETSVRRLIDARVGRVSPRKLRLFMAGWCRRPWEQYGHAVLPDVVEAVERFADGLDDIDQFIRNQALFTQRLVWSIPSELLLETNNRRLLGTVRRFCDAIGNLAFEPVPEWRKTEQCALAVLFRDVVGNPFRPASIDMMWSTSTVTALAQQMYDSRDFSAMPILADALQDAGCDNDDILNHCRHANAIHVRGCWVIDLVLGKT